MARKGSKRTTRKSSSPGLSLSYSGPVRLSTNDGQDHRPLKANLTWQFAAASNSSGVLAGTVTTSGISYSSDWTSYTNVYQEYRILAMELHYEPFFNGSYDATVVQSAGASATAHTPAGVPASLDEVIQLVTWKPFRTSAQLKQYWKMFGVEESGFLPVSTLTNFGGIVYYTDQLSPDTAYGRGIVTFLVEFRGRK